MLWKMQVNRSRVHLRRLLTEPVAELSRAQRAARYGIDLARHCTRELIHDRAGTMAAALTFHTMFSLLPTLALMLVVLQAFVTDAQLERLKEGTVNYVLQWMETAEEASENVKEAVSTDDQTPDVEQQVQEAPPGDAWDAIERSANSMLGVLGFGGDRAPPAVAGEATTEPNIAGGAAAPPVTATEEDRRRLGLESTARAVRKNIQGWLDELETISFGRIGVVGILLFIYAATGLLGTIESSFNRIYDAPAGRRWYVRLPMYYTLVTLGPLVILGGQWVQGQLLTTLQAAPAAALGPVVQFLAGALSFLSPIVTTWLVLLALYMLLPHTRVKLRTAAIGAFVSAVGWVALIELFGLYFRNAAAGNLYGALALLPLFLMWLWITWLIILFGLELSYALQHLRTGRFKSLKNLAEDDLLVDPRWIVPLMALVGDGFAQGKTVSDDELATRLSLPVRAVRHLTRALREEGLLHQAAGEGLEEQARWVLARPPGSIRLAMLLAVGDELSLDRRANPSVPGAQMLEALRRSQQQYADGQTLDAIMSVDAAAADAPPPARA